MPRFALRPDEAAESIGVSRDWFDDYVKPEIETVDRGRVVLVPLDEIKSWIARNKTRIDF